jgi:hypothetical protein
VVPKLLPPFLQYSTYSKSMQVAPITMAYQPDADSDLLTSLPDPATLATNMIIDNTPYITVPNKNKKQPTGSSANTIPSFFQRRPLPSPQLKHYHSMKNTCVDMTLTLPQYEEYLCRYDFNTTTV